MLQEPHGELDFPISIVSRLAPFYGRAGKVECMGSPQRKGSLAIFGTIDELSGPLVTHTLQLVQTCWSVDGRLASRRHFPEISWRQSNSNYLHLVEEQCGSEILNAQDKLKRILRKEDELAELVSKVGKVSRSV